MTAAGPKSEGGGSRSDTVVAARDIAEARRLFPATVGRAYFNTAATGLASRRLAETYHADVDEWAAHGLDWTRREQAANEARSAAARLIGADPADLALIPSVSSAAGLAAAQLDMAGHGENVVIGETEDPFSSFYGPHMELSPNRFTIRQLDQLARHHRQHGRPRGVRALRTRRRARPQP